MSEFKNVSIVIAAINETYSLRQTVEQILALCNREDLAEVLIVVCKRLRLSAYPWRIHSRRQH